MRIAPKGAEASRLRQRKFQLLRTLKIPAEALPGSLALTYRRCGKPTCRCTRGEKHISLYVVVGQGGKPRQLFVPHSLEPQARQWVASYRRIRELLDELSELYWDKLRRREPPSSDA
jgi:hypothetical protein